MALNYTALDVESGYGSRDILNENFSNFETAAQDALSRSGVTPNTMGVNLDMNSYRILNLPVATSNQEPVTLGQLLNDESFSLIQGFLVNHPTTDINDFLTVIAFAIRYNLATGQMGFEDNGRFFGDLFGGPDAGTLLIDAINQQVQINLALADDSVGSSTIQDLAVLEGKLADLAVTEDKVAASAITTAKIAADAVTSAELADAAATEAKIAADAVTTTKIADDAITTPKITAGAVTTDEIAANTIVAGNIASNTITAAEIAAGTITAAEIAAGTITASEIAAGTITATELATDSVTTDKIIANAVTAAKIAVETITANELATDSVTSAKILAGAVTAAELAAGAVVAGKIDTDAVTSGTIAAGAVGSAAIAAGAVIAGKIATDAITASGGEIADAAIISAKIADLAVNTAHIEELSVNTLKLGVDVSDVIFSDEAIKSIRNRIAMNMQGYEDFGRLAEDLWGGPDGGTALFDVINSQITAALKYTSGNSIDDLEPSEAGATGNAVTSSSSDPTGGTDGDLHYNTSSNEWWSKISGAWVKVADETAAHQAASIAGQGDLATADTADFATQVSGAEKPDDNATKNSITSGSGDPSGGAAGDLYWETTNQQWWANIGGTWTKVSDITAANIAAEMSSQQLTQGNLVFNGGFETGDSTGWSLESASVSSDEAHDGTYSLHQQEAAGGPDSLSGYIHAYQNERFLIECWAMRDESTLPAGDCHIGFREYDGSKVQGTVHSALGTGDHSTSGWQYLRGVGTCSDSDCEFIRVDLNTGAGGSGYWYFDDVRCSVIPKDADIDALLTTNAPGEAGADVTGSNTAAAITGQGDLATADDIDASLVVSGTMADARIGASNVTQHEGSLSLGAGQLTSGTLADARVASSNVTQHEGSLALGTSQITSGTFADARIASSNVTQYQGSLSLAASQTTSGSFADARIPNLATSKITSGTFADARIAASNVTQHEGSLSIGYPSQLSGSIPDQDSVGGITIVSNPGGAEYAENGSVSGSLKIRFPTDYNSCMLRFDVDIYNYVTGASIKFEIGGYAYGSGSYWYNIFAVAHCQASTPNANLEVRFGDDGTYACVWIGTTSANWSYPHLKVRNFLGSYSGYSYSTWNDNWAISRVGSYGNVRQTITETRPHAATIVDQGDFATYDDNEGTAGAITSQGDLATADTVSQTQIDNYAVARVSYNDASSHSISTSYQTLLSTDLTLPSNITDSAVIVDYTFCFWFQNFDTSGAWQYLSNIYCRLLDDDNSSVDARASYYTTIKHAVGAEHGGQPTGTYYNYAAGTVAGSFYVPEANLNSNQANTFKLQAYYTSSISWASPSVSDVRMVATLLNRSD